MGTGTGVQPWAQTRNETAGENLQKDAVQIRLILLGLRILVLCPLAFVAAEETRYYCADNK